MFLVEGHNADTSSSFIAYERVDFAPSNLSIHRSGHPLHFDPVTTPDLHANAGDEEHYM